MNKFGLLDESAEERLKGDASIDHKIALFSAVRPKMVVDVEAIDAAAAQHGFTSREPASRGDAPLSSGRRRRAVPSEPSRHLAIRLPSSGYDRFVAFADRQKLTYHDALIRLMDKAGE